MNTSYFICAMFYATVLILALSGSTHAYNCSVSGSTTVCQLEVTEDVFVYNSGNQNHFDFLIAGNHPGYPLKRTLLKFENIPSAQCGSIQKAEMYVYYWYAHKASFQSEQQVPFIPRPLQARQILKSWSETQATRDNRLRNTPWSTQYLGLDNTDVSSRVEDTQTISRSTSSGYITWNVTNVARNWLRGDTNNGVFLFASNDNQFGREIRFYSRENRINRKPYMTVYCGSSGTVTTASTPTPLTTTTSTCAPCPATSLPPTCPEVTCPTTPPPTTCPSCPVVTCPTSPPPTTCPSCPEVTCPTTPPPPTCPSCPVVTCPTSPPPPTCPSCPEVTCPTVDPPTCPSSACSSSLETMLRFKLGGTTYLNNTVVMVDDIGEGKEGLYCITSNTSCCGNSSQPSFYFPNGALVRGGRKRKGNYYKNKGRGFVRLNRKNTGQSPTGQYRCQIPDASGVNQNLYINIVSASQD